MNPNLLEVVMRYLILTAFLILGCSDSSGPEDEPCEWQEMTVDVIYNTATAVVQMELVARLQKEGWACPSQFIYNPEGEAIGRQYICNICK